jgi:hypothetical protein
MAKGLKCPVKTCGHYMRAVKEDEQKMGTWVTYYCAACGNEVRQFEDKPFNPYEKDLNEKRR